MPVANLLGKVPDSWVCVDCGVNTAPGCLNREQMEQAFAIDWEKKGATMTFNERSEVYLVKPAVWKAAGMVGGCLCIGCLEKRMGRILVPKDFVHNDPLHSFPGTQRLRARRDGS